MDVRIYITAIFAALSFCMLTGVEGDCTVTSGYLLCKNISHTDLLRIGREHASTAVATFICNSCSLITLPPTILRHWWRTLRAILITDNANDFLLADSNFDRLSDLTTLRIANSRVLELRKRIFKGVYNLIQLDLSGSLIKNIPENVFSRMEGLTELNFAHGNIETLHNGSFAGLTPLKKLLLQDNKIKHVPEEVFTPLISLMYLDLSDNPIVTFNYPYRPMKIHVMTVFKINWIPCKTMRKVYEDQINGHTLVPRTDACHDDIAKNCTYIDMVNNESRNRKVVISETAADAPITCDVHGIPCSQGCL